MRKRLPKFFGSTFFGHLYCAILASLALIGSSTDCRAWGGDGHAAIGILSISQLQDGARTKLEDILGPLNEQGMTEVCNWPDTLRETEKWEWSAPQHYINIPRGDFSYLESRDCPDQLCATQAVKKYAAILANHRASRKERWRAFAWLCHLSGDLHQPLHAGFEDDRGGNDIDVVVRGEKMNLHHFWDTELINQHAGDSKNLVARLQTPPLITVNSEWSPGLVDGWTDDSHRLAEAKAYPASVEIDQAWEQQSWEIVQQRLVLAASRLALMINTLLHDAN